MYEYIDDKKLMSDIEMLMKIPQYRASLFHKVEELKSKDENGAGKILEYRELEKMIDPEKKEKSREPVKETRFEIKKTKAGWMVNPVDISQKIVKHITTMDLSPGVIKMDKFKSGGKMINLSFEMKSPSRYTGSISGKCSENEKKTKQKVTKPRSKKDKLKTLITYLVGNETFSDWLLNEFFEKWKTVIDNGFGFITERSHY